MAKASKASLLIIFVTVFIDLLGFGIVLPLLPRYGEHFRAHDITLGLLMASFSAMQFLFAPFWGRVSDRVGRRPILILGLAGSTVSYALFGVITARGPDAMLLGMGGLTWLFITRIGAGIAGATISTAQAYIADTTKPEERAKGMALIGAAFGVGFTFGPLLGAAFVSSEGKIPSAAPGYVAACLSALALLSAIFVLPESLQPGSRSAVGHKLFDLASLRTAIRQPSIGLILFTMFLTVFAFGQFETTLSLLTERLGLLDRENFYVFAYIGLILTLSQGLIVRRLVPKVGEFRMGLAGTMLMAAGLLLTGVAALQGSLTMLYVVLPLCVMGFSALNPSLQSLLSRRTDASEQGGMLGLGQSIAALARILAPVCGMRLFTLGTAYPYWSGCGIMAMGVLLLLAIGRPAPANGA